MYSDDFTTPDAAYTPVSDGLFVGVSPLLILLGLIVLAGVAALAWRLGRGSVSGDRGDDAAPAEIHKAILAASSAAMSASINDLKGRAQALRDRIHDLLGPVLDVAKGVAPAVKGLDEALKGEKKPEAKPAHGAAPSQACACAKPDACTCKTSSPASAAPVTVNQVYIGGAPVAPSGCDCKGTHKADCGHGSSDTHGPVSEKKPAPLAMTGPEQVEALSRAVRQFHDHWLDGPARIREMKAARAALSRRPAGHAHNKHGH